MAHLIKLEDYTSRYMHDMQRYLSRFSRLKKERWEAMKRDWRKVNNDRPFESTQEESLEDWLEEAENGMLHGALSRLKQFQERGKKRNQNHDADERTLFYEGKSLDELKDLFYEDLFMAQLRWASASLLEESRMDPMYKYDQILRFLLRNLPDNYLVLYYPVFSVGRAPLDMDIILVSPTAIICLAYLPGEKNSVFETSSGRYWNEYVHKSRKRIINPVISLNRMTSVIQSIFKEESPEMELHRAVWSPSSVIDHRVAGMKVEMADKRNHDAWFDKIKRNPSPIKKNQLYAAETLLQHTLTTSFRRREEMEDREGED
ncbi:nuclease-related domain-containing protein [Salibacterium sp. K-3]